jgi:lipid-binding SYLF domain-containing protein
MKRLLMSVATVALLLSGPVASADEYSDTVDLFKNAGESGKFFARSYGYAVFPTVGKAGFVVGGAHGDGRVYVGGVQVGTTTVTQLSVGFQAGGQAFSMIIFFQDKAAFEDFTKGNFEFGAGVSAVAITAAAGAATTTTGSTAGASGGKNDAVTAGDFNNGVAIFTIVKGGAMYEAAVSGMKFSFKPK